MRNPAFILAIGTPLLLAAVAPSATHESATIEAKTNRKILRHCGTSEAHLVSAPDADWTPVLSAGAKQTALRQALDEPMPNAQSMVSIHAIGGDLATIEFSIVLTRGDDGQWKGTAVGQSKIWIEGAKPTIIPRRAWTIPLDRGHRLDALLVDKCFYAEPSSFHNDQAPPVGSLFMTLETQTPYQQRRVSYKGGNVEGLTKEVNDLTFPPPAE